MIVLLKKLFSVSFAAALLLCCLFVLPSESLANPKYASLVIDADTGVIIHQESADKYRYPASLTKMMTLYLTFQALDQGMLKMNQNIRVSSRAAGQPPSRLGLRRGENITVRDAIQSVIVKSANDSAVVLSEAVGGSEWQFAMKMNRMAKKLGMNHTNFKNASGLHDRRQQTTAYDMARLAVALKRDYRKYYHLFNKNKFFYKGRMYSGHNNVTKKYRGADGLKTGYVRASGYNLVTSASRSGRNVVGVVLGGRSSNRRDREMIRLLDGAFSKLAHGGTGGAKIRTSYAPEPKLKSNVFTAKTRPKPELKPATMVIRNGIVPVMKSEGYGKVTPVLASDAPTPSPKPETSTNLSSYRERNLFSPAKKGELF